MRRSSQKTVKHVEELGISSLLVLIEAKKRRPTCCFEEVKVRAVVRCGKTATYRVMFKGKHRDQYLCPKHGKLMEALYG